MTERRFTDREVARILERAAELDRRAADRLALPDGSQHVARGLTVAQLQEIGVEAGIPPEYVARAAGELRRPPSVRLEALVGPSTVRRQTRSVPAPLQREDLADLVRVVDERVPAQGTATEALGAVRWAATNRWLDRQVTLEPREGETLIRVEERFGGQVPGMLHGIPAAYGAMGGLVAGLEWLGGGAAAGLGGAIVLSLVAWMLGHLVWGAVSQRSETRTVALADELAEMAAGMVGGAGHAPGEEVGAEADPAPTP
jgi:hypothetical protein